jgi:hypothetical protein
MECAIMAFGCFDCNMIRYVLRVVYDEMFYVFFGRRRFC